MTKPTKKLEYKFLIEVYYKGKLVVAGNEGRIRSNAKETTVAVPNLITPDYSYWEDK